MTHPDRTVEEQADDIYAQMMSAAIGGVEARRILASALHHTAQQSAARTWELAKEKVCRECRAKLEA